LRDDHHARPANFRIGTVGTSDRDESDVPSGTGRLVTQCHEPPFVTVAGLLVIVIGVPIRGNVVYGPYAPPASSPGSGAVGMPIGRARERVRRAVAAAFDFITTYAPHVVFAELL
jgi:hypothetical protein